MSPEIGQPSVQGKGGGLGLGLEVRLSPAELEVTSSSVSKASSSASVKPSERAGEEAEALEVEGTSLVACRYVEVPQGELVYAMRSIVKGMHMQMLEAC